MGSLTTKEQQALKLFKEGLHRLFARRVADLRLFGSKARGDASADSDVDVLVVLTAGDWHDERGILDLATEIFAETGVMLSPKVYTRSQITDMRRRHNMFLQSVERDAVPL